MFDGVVELVDPFGEEAPAPPELLEVLAALGVERVDLARRSLLGRDLLDVGEAPLLDPDEEGVDGPLDDVGEASLAQLCMDPASEVGDQMGACHAGRFRDGEVGRGREGGNDAAQSAAARTVGAKSRQR